MTSIFLIADLLNVELVVRRYPNQDGRWCCRFHHAEVMEDGLLRSASGNSAVLIEAIEDYCKQIAGKRVAFDAMSSTRREFVMPVDLVAPPV